MNYFSADSLGPQAAVSAPQGPQGGAMQYDVQYDNTSTLTEETDPRNIPFHELDCFKDGSMLAELQSGAPNIYNGLVLQHQAQQQQLLHQHMQQQHSFHRQQQVIASEQARLIGIAAANAATSAPLPVQMANAVPPVGVPPPLNVSPVNNSIPPAAMAPCPPQNPSSAARGKLRRAPPMNAQQLTAIALAMAAANSGNGSTNSAVADISARPSVPMPAALPAAPASNKRSAAGPAQSDAEKREERKLLRAARNRQSATSSRERKKRHLKELNRRFDLFTRENARLESSEVEWMRNRIEREKLLQHENQHLRAKIEHRKTNIADLSHAIGHGDHCPYTPSVPTTPADGGMNIVPPNNNSNSNNVVAAAAAAVAGKALPPVPEKPVPTRRKLHKPKTWDNSTMGNTLRKSEF